MLDEPMAGTQGCNRCDSYLGSVVHFNLRAVTCDV